jgi:hypothetical protein
MWWPKTLLVVWILLSGGCFGIGQNEDTGIKVISGLPISIGIQKTPENGFLNPGMNN